MATFNFFDWLRGAKTNRVAQAAEHEAVKDDGADFRPLHVMVSSPRKVFEAEREALFSTIEAQHELKSLLFEKLPDSGRTNIRESIDLAQQCDILIALLSPGELGSPVSQEQLSQLAAMGLKGTHFSEIELELAFRRTEGQTRLPLIHIYVKGPKDTKVAPTDWHAKYCEEIAYKTFETPEQLVEHVRKDILGNAIKLRALRVRYLAKQVLEAQRDLEIAKREISRKEDERAHLMERIAAVEKARDADKADADERLESVERSTREELRRRGEERKAEIAYLLERQQEDRAILESSHREVQAQMRDAHRDVVATLNEEATRLRADLAARRYSAVRLLAAGFAAGAVPLLVFVGLGSGISGTIGRQMHESFAVLGTAIVQRPVYVSHAGGDPMLLARKVALAGALTGGSFDCDGAAQTRVPVSLGGQQERSAVLVRESVCSPFGDVQLEILAAGLKPCVHEPVLKSDWWQSFADHVKRTANGGPLGSWRIAEIRLLGHASGEEVSSACRDLVPPEIFGQVRAAGFAVPHDRRIVNNTQLAFARALRQERELRDGFRRVTGVLEPKIVSQTMGILDAKGHSSTDPSNHRKVTVAMRLERAQ